MEEFTKVSILENDIEAQLVESILTERGIPHRMRSYHDTAYDGLYQSQKGWGYVSAPKTFHGAVMDIISDLRREAERSDDPS
ncbi:MAG: hypothetical protein R6V46_01930 [Desulfatiglandaceae bacterium]|jgi:hypothetical protein